MPAVTPESPPIHVLVAARRPEDRRAVLDALTPANGWAVEEAATFAAALRRCHDGGVSCLLLHLDLPDVGILEALAALARDVAASAVPVVVLSSHLGDDYCLELVAAGADDAIGDDGLRSGGVRRTVAHAMARRRARRWGAGAAATPAGAAAAPAPATTRAEPASTTAAMQMRASETRARLALQCADLGAWERDLQTGRIVWSPECAAIFGVPLDAFTGDYEQFEAFVVPEDKERVRATSAESLRSGSAGTGAAIEFRIRRPDGELRWLVNLGGVVAEPDGSAARVVGIVGDITTRKLAEVERERLLTAERAARVEADRAGRLKDEFLATISHELRTPLNSILGWARLLLRPGVKPETYAEGVRVIERNAKVQAQLIADLLDVNRIVSGRLQLELDDLDVREAAAAALDTVLPSAQERGLELVPEYAAELPNVRADASRLQQVIWNLLTNAIKFTPERGRVTLAVRRDGADVVVEVRDTGQGIDPEFLPHVFDRFTQADGSTSRCHGGLGLGLAIVRQLVEMHGGRVTADSAGLGRGACFSLRLPAVDAVGDAPAAAPSGRDCLAGLEILLVDDQPDALEFTRRLLADHGAAVRTAAGGVEALKELRTRTPARLPALLVSDIGMPGMDGYELLRAVRTELCLGPAELPAMAVTAFGREDDRRDARAVGYQAHVTKPFQADRLIAAVRALARPPDAVRG
jgi:PAS domain S-box-containing protein